MGYDSHPVTRLRTYTATIGQKGIGSRTITIAAVDQRQAFAIAEEYAWEENERVGHQAIPAIEVLDIDPLGGIIHTYS